MRMDISRKKLSRDLGVSDDYISKVERGVMTCSPDIIAALAVYLNVSTDYLLMGGGPDLKEIQPQTFRHASSRFVMAFLPFFELSS